MSGLTGAEAYGLMEAYNSMYPSQEEQYQTEEVGIQIIENAAYILFSQGYNIDDVISYFTEASREVITEDAIAISEGLFLVESVLVSDEYIAEQFEILYEGLLDQGLKFAAKPMVAAGNALLRGGKKAEALGRLRNIQNIKNVKNAVPAVPPGTAKITTSGGNTVGRNMIQRAGDWAKGVVKKIPGAGTAEKIAKGSLGKFAGKALPVAGAALYGADAADRLKKGDWGGAALSGAGAVTSLIPGANLVAGLAPAAIQMGTDALGLTGDKSRKGNSGKTPPASPPSLKSKQDYAAGKGKYYSSSDQKTYGNYNDALAARNSRRGTPGVTPGKAPSAPVLPRKAPSAPVLPPPSGTGGGNKSTTSSTPSKNTSEKPTATPMQQWAKANPTLAANVKPGQSGYDEVSQMRVKPGPNEKQDQTPTTGPKVDLATAQSDVKKSMDSFTPRDMSKNPLKPAKPAAPRNGFGVDARKLAAQSSVNSSFDLFDAVLGHLLDEGYADTEEAALVIMSNMSEEWRQSIVEETLNEKLAKGTKGVSFSTGKKQGGFDQAMTEKNPRTNRQRATSPMLKAMDAHSKAKQSQWDAERSGDSEVASRHQNRREKIAHVVYNKTNRIIDRADND